MLEHLHAFDDIQFEGDSEVITTELWIGTNFVIHGEDDNDNGVNYYVLFVSRPKFRVHLPFICPWDNEFRTGDYAIKDMYYQIFGRNKTPNYVWLARS